VPVKGENRIRAMVEGRPDWVLSRQRAWGVPITLFVDRKSGQYLCDADVNARIIAAVRETGVDAWCDERAQEYLGERYNAADYERVADILDVWFDSGCTHAFVLESGKWPDLVREGPADLYLEGSDQHRGWFQSSLLESCGTRGRAPYKAVLTHGFTMDAKGMKMSKSLGNTVSPTDLMRDSGADILRLWALTVDFTEDHRIGKEILAGVSDQYRKLRNTFRYLLGALEGFSDAEKIAVADMPELERYVLHLLADMDAKLKTAVNDFDFNSYTRLISDFANNDLSAFFFDIRKDSLYCDAPTNPKRMAYRTVLDILFHALVRYAAPVLVFTAEEIWLTRFPDAQSVHFSDWPDVAAGWIDGILEAKWRELRTLRVTANLTLEYGRAKKDIGSSLESVLKISCTGEAIVRAAIGVDLAELCIASEVELLYPSSIPVSHSQEWLNIPSMSVRELPLRNGNALLAIEYKRTTHAKCNRCWRHLPDVGTHAVHPELCERCVDVVSV
jgi:isoleucyl-tRNA synthetase